MSIFEEPEDTPGELAEYLETMERPPAPDGWPTCRGCGCWDLAACWDEDVGACSWIEPDLCSHCAAGALEAGQ